MENKDCSNINFDEVIRSYLSRVIALGTLLGCFLSFPALTGPAAIIGFSNFLKIAFATIESSYQTMIIGATTGAVGSACLDRSAHLVGLKCCVIPRINELLQVAVETNQALRKNELATSAQVTEVRKLKRD